MKRFYEQILSISDDELGNKNTPAKHEQRRRGRQSKKSRRCMKNILENELNLKSALTIYPTQMTMVRQFNEDCIRIREIVTEILLFMALYTTDKSLKYMGSKSEGEEDPSK